MLYPLTHSISRAFLNISYLININLGQEFNNLFNILTYGLYNKIFTCFIYVGWEV